MFRDTSTSGQLVLCQHSLSCANLLSSEEKNCGEKNSTAVLELVMNFSPNIPAVPATLFFMALIKYLACSTFTLPKAKR